MSAVYPTKHLTTLDEWRKIGEANIYPPNSRIELINGEILDMAPIGFGHAGHVTRLMNLFAPYITNKALMTAQNPLQLGDLSEPEPDFMLMKLDNASYTTRHPNPDDVLLLIEVADRSLRFDQTEKLRLYALHNIPEYWILNLNNSSLEVYRKPNGETYAEKTTLGSGDHISLSQLPGLSIHVADIL